MASEFEFELSARVPEDHAEVMRSRFDHKLEPFWCEVRLDGRERIQININLECIDAVSAERDGERLREEMEKAVGYPLVVDAVRPC
jgi:hypothetical protein